MQENERRQRLISSTPQLSPEEIATRSFGTKVRGYAESEVRSFLKRVSEQLSGAREREHELEAAVDALEEQLRQPRPLSEQQLLDALGEETARLLRSAREASDDIRTKAEERAVRMIEEAQAAAERTRAEATEVLVSRTEQAEAKASEMLGAAEARANELKAAAAAELESVVESARHQGREMIDEAKAARERVLGDLVRRRALLQAQIEELRGGRDRLLDAYRTVKRTFLEATEALGQVEARAAVERASTAEPIDVAAEIAAEIEALEAAHAADTDATQMLEPVLDVRADAPAEIVIDEVEGDDDSATKLADVDSLFARLRAGHGDTAESIAAGAVPAPAPVATAESAPSPADEPVASVPVESAASPEPAPAAEPAAPRVTAIEWRARRAKAIDPPLNALVKRAKRTAQDDQNALLDAVRRHKGRPTAEQVLPGTDAAVREWMDLVHEAVDRAYGAGRTAAGATGQAVPDDLVREAAEAIIMPLHERLTVAMSSDDGGDTGGLVERIGARYREWKNQALERGLAEALAFAWSRGVYDAVPDGSVLWWVPSEQGRCSDCDDNALEPTVKGKQFPTGQAFPPAHPGCKCLLAPAESLEPPVDAR